MIYNFKDFHKFLNQPNSYSLFVYADEAYKKSKGYRTIYITKRNGSQRVLQAPSQKLKWIQRQLLLFFEYGQISSHASAYKKDCCIVDNASPHVKQKTIVKLDIENFFGSISFPQVFHAIDLALSASPLVGKFTGLQKSDSASSLLEKRNFQNYNSELSWYFTKLCTLGGSLPQGAPTSPIISNMVFFPMDCIIASYCHKHHINYTRYSDDMTFSGDFPPAGLIFFVRKLLLEKGFRLNDDKTTILGSGRRHSVTGVVVNERTQAHRSYRRKIRQEMYFIGKYGVMEHMQHCLAAQDPIKKLQRLMGQINYVLQLDPQNREFMEYKKDCLHLLELIPRL